MGNGRARNCFVVVVVVFAHENVKSDISFTKETSI